jgi:regulator of PEP synthase PpsR (kinase-PPPase family)
VARAAQAQFSTHPTTLVRHPRVTTLDGLSRAFERIGEATGKAVFFTLIDRELRKLTTEICQREGIPHCDLLGPPLEALTAASGDEAELVPGRQAPLDKDYFKRVAAMEFAVKHDDGLSGEGLEDAEIVLIGVSRTGKTPLSMYLGYLGYKTANVPLVKGIEPPAELFQIDQSKVVGLTIDATRLSEIRGERIRWMGGDRKYADLVEIYEELEYAAQVHRRLGCPVLEVSELSIEEISHRIIQLVERRKAEAG